MLQSALWYAKQGIAVFPLYGIKNGCCTCGNRDCRNPGKHPRTKNGLKDATTDAAQINSWWKMWPDSNIGIATGSASGIVVLDVDTGHGAGVNGADTLAEWETEQGELPDTWISLTGGGGAHYIFKKPPALEIKNRAGVLPGLDVRGDGGYIVAPPSVHVSGRAYEWEVNHEPDSTPLAPLPESLYRLMVGKQEIKPAFEMPETIGEGARNDTLFRLASSLRAKGLSEPAIKAAVTAENQQRCRPPLSAREIDLLCSSVSRYEPGALPVSSADDIDWDTLTVEQLTNKEIFAHLAGITDHFEQTQAITKAEARARQLRILKTFQKNFKSYRAAQLKKVMGSGGNKTCFTGQPLELNCGEWSATDAGVTKKEYVRDGDIIERVASPIPILPTELLYNIDSDTEKLRLEFFKDGRWKYIICDRKIAASQQKIIDLADYGIEVNSENAKMLVKYIADCVSLNLDILPRHRSISRLGWVDDGFMPYDKEIRFDGEKENKPLFDCFTQAGDYDEWVQFVSPLRKNIYLRLQMAASFASPLIERVNGLPFVLHLWGSSGAGKTVGMMVAMSVWGNPRLGKLVRTMNMTANSMLSTVAFLHNIPFAGDELQTIKSRWTDYDQLIMKVTEGIDRGRMSYDRNNALKTWKCCFLFTGEEPCTKSSSGGGVKNRVIEIECDGPVVENGNRVVSFINENYGYAGIRFIKAIADYKNLAEDYTHLMDAIITSGDTTEKQAMAAAYLLLGDKLATETIFTDERPLKIAEIAPFLTSAAEVDVAGRAYDYIMSVISQNIRKFKDTNYDEVWGKIIGDKLLFDKNVLCNQLESANFSFDAVKRAWADRGWIQKFGQAYSSKLLAVNGTARTHAVSFAVTNEYGDDVPWQE